MTARMRSGVVVRSLRGGSPSALLGASLKPAAGRNPNGHCGGGGGGGTCQGMERQSVLGRRSLAPSSDSASAHRGLRREVLVLLNLVVDALELDLLRGGDGPGGGGRPACGREGALASHHSLLLRCNSLHCSPLHTVPTVPFRVDLGIALGAAGRAWPWMNAEASDMARTSEIKLGRKGFHGILCSPEFCALLLLSRSRARLFFFPHRVDSQFSL